MTKKLVLAAMIPLFLLALSTAPADARGRGCLMDEDGSSSRLEMIAERLDLSDEQVKQFEEIHEGKREKRIAFQKEMRQLRHNLEGVMMEDDPDAGRARNLTEAIGALHTKMQVDMLDMRLTLRSILTQEQRDKFIGAFRGRGGNRIFGGGQKGMGDSGFDCDYNDCNRQGRGKGRSHGGHGSHRGHGGHGNGW